MLVQANALHLPLADESVQCVVTSPPYWGLRDYKIIGQLGLERTPEEYVAQIVAVFREVRRVLRDDGTVWLNLGDSYAGHHGNRRVPDEFAPSNKPGYVENMRTTTVGISGLKPKDLVGIPWRVAFALQAPYYTGTIKRVEDRIWLAAIVDGEGCMFIHKRKAGQSNGQGYERKNDTYGSGLEVANCHESIVRRCMEITGRGSVCFQDKESRLKNRNQRLFRWNLRSNECREVIREIYPYLIGKQHEARLAYNCPSSGRDAERAHVGLIALHNGFPSDIDFPEPPNCLEPGWYLRSDIIWSKNNPMPESVQDRPTRSHEYLFLLTKAARYYYDAAAIRTPAKSKTTKFPDGWDTGLGAHGTYHRNGREQGKKADKQRGHSRRHDGFNDRWDAMEKSEQQQHGANARSVWTIATQPYKGAHFATFPTALVTPCILAGSRPGDIILDPFAGSGTVGLVCQQTKRQFIGCDLNMAYLRQAQQRVENRVTTPVNTTDLPLFGAP